MDTTIDQGPRIPGHATAEGTAGHRDKGRLLDGVSLSTVGLGTYLGEDDDGDDALYLEAIGRALDLGINVLDTAINYRSQRSERVIGAALRRALDDKRVRREEVVIASKAGYLPFDGGRPRHLNAYFEETYIRTGIVRADELCAGCHCMSPRYLADQIDRSRRNLGLATVDVYYLHNPETQFADVDRAEFLRRLREAFAALEGACADGKIRVYGTATWNGYRSAPPGGPAAPPSSGGGPFATEHLSLEQLVGIAREVGGAGHHFKVVQLPFNLAMPEAFALPNQSLDGKWVSLLEAAEALGVYVMASASLLQGQLAERLPAEIRAALGLATDAQRALQFVRSTPGIGTALVGMKRAAHVEEMAEVERTPPVGERAIRDLFEEQGAGG